MDGSFSSRPTRKRRSQELEASHGILHTLESKKEKILQDAQSLDLLPVGEAPRKATGIDRLSRLQDEILGTIVSLLSTRDVAHMQVVSRLWCQIWHSTSLSLDMRAFSVNEQKQTIIAGKILAAH
uniref:F-box domain-containing protein n=1 Tax=Oryza brachyantha TaxID=4533 RepID=J3MK19_ORYBR